MEAATEQRAATEQGKQAAPPPRLRDRNFMKIVSLAPEVL